MLIVWKTIENFPNYEINRLGQIRNRKTGKILKPFDDCRGYLRVRLNGINCKVHVLVAKQFIPNPENKPIVNHKHGNKHDNRASQLEWMTQSENIKHAWDNKLIKRRTK